MLLLTQIPGNGDRLVRYSGDCLKLVLKLSTPQEGEAFVRTNLCRGGIRRSEVISQVEKGNARFGRDWHDIPMPQTGPGQYSLTLPLCEVGMFEFKCFFLAKDNTDPQWPRGENTRIKVEPPGTAANNTIYNAFVRQFGRNRSGGSWNHALQEAEHILDSNDYTVVPPSGTFRDLKAEIPFIMDELGFRLIQLLPIHPVPTTFARMGRFGSPFAPIDFFTVDSSMATFDRRTTPLEQFCELVDTIHAHNGMVLIDLPADHTGWASTMQVHHPEWFCRNDDGSFASPGAWGVIWEDLCKLNFSDQRLWKAMAEVFLNWVRLGVDGFRCDAGYMVPLAVWEYIAAKVREQYPDTIFFLEGLGGPPDDTEHLLQDGRLNWAYSELFQCYEPQQIRDYLTFAFGFAKRNGCLVHFAETHDNDRLAARSARWAAMRTGLAALTSMNGAFGIANGVEWLATEKIDVHGAASLNWGGTPNLVEHLKRLNRILRTHPAFGPNVDVRIPSSGTGNAVGLLRLCQNRRDSLMVVCNVNEHESAWFEWETYELDLGDVAYDLLSDQRVDITRTEGRLRVDLLPGQMRCLARHPLSLETSYTRNVNEWQQLRDCVLKSIVYYYKSFDMTGVDIEDLARLLREDPKKFLRRLFSPELIFPLGGLRAPSALSYLPYLEWRPGQDERRLVMLAPEHVILVSYPHRFRASLICNGRCLSRQLSVKGVDGQYHAFFTPVTSGHENEIIEMHVEMHDGDVTQRVVGRLWVLPPSALERPVNLRVDASRLDDTTMGLCTTETGGYVLARGIWGLIRSKYDAFLAANPALDYPEDRKILVSRFQVWLNYRDYTVELGRACQTSFACAHNLLQWDFTIPSGMGQAVYLTIYYEMAKDCGNRCRMKIVRHIPNDFKNRKLDLERSRAITLVVRPEIDSRVNHRITLKTGLDGRQTCAEKAFLAALKAEKTGFIFNPDGDCGLRMWSNAAFKTSPKWRGVHFAEDAERGLEADGDVFSPGEFTCDLLGGDSFDLQLEGLSLKGQEKTLPVLSSWNVPELTYSQPLLDVLSAGMEAFVVNREHNKTVIAGYPWFLDWGRDTLICLRGLISAGHFAESRDIIRQFASFEDKGTIPNMIHGQDSRDRATSDAPLWLFVAVADYLKQAPDGGTLLQMDCGRRSLLDVLKSVVENYLGGVANGIAVDAESGLVYSPSHYTWMDTNYPAGTPRQGYPIEIQALWIHALTLLVDLTKDDKYVKWRTLAAESLKNLYVRDDGCGLRDCLHAGNASIGARKAKGDDAIRPNQLLMLTLTDVLDGQPVVEDILLTCAQLLVPGAIRSLAPLPVSVPLRIEWNGNVLNNPYHPYWGQYAGVEDVSRKPAYHNGTAWGWLMPSYCEAMFKAFHGETRDVAKALLSSVIGEMERGCIGFLPEICDGDTPHASRGCCAQAWSMGEVYRVCKMLQNQ